jgi:hypothetical protein
MPAIPWNWKDQVGTPAWIWRKVCVLSHNYGESVLRLAGIPISVLPYANKAVGPVLDMLFRADLNISVLDEHSLKPVDGVPPPVTAKDGSGPVYFDGVETTFTVSHNTRGKEHITLERIELHMVSFAPGQDPDFAYQRNGERYFGAGPMVPQRFSVELKKEGPMPARRKLGDDPKPIVAHGPNFFDTEPSGIYDFAPNETPVIIKIALTALDAGYYETCLLFFYRVAARELRQYTSDPVRIYTKGRGRS